MVYDISGEGTNKKKPRFTIKGKLIGMTTDSSKGSVDKNAGKFDFLTISIVNPEEKVVIDNIEKDRWYNINCWKIDLNKLPELKKADNLLQQKKRPLVQMVVYETEYTRKNQETGKPLTEEVEEERNGKKVIVVKEVKGKSLRASNDDLKTSFKILEEDTNEKNPTEQIEEEEIQA